jgi:hypothetical protein
MASRVHDPEGAGFTPPELALLRALPLMKSDMASPALDALREHFDVDEDRGEIGQVVYAYGMYRGLHAANAILGVEFLDDEGRPLSERNGFGVVTTADGRWKARSEIDLP